MPPIHCGPSNILAMLSTWALRATVLAIYLGSAYLVNVEVTEPYLDEIFHIPQAQKYCSGNFSEWDPSITTPPGLYFISATISWLTRTSCTVGKLRFLNVLLGCVFSPWVCKRIMTGLTREHLFWTGKPERHAPNVVNLRTLISGAIVASTFPLVFFFSLLYYTDVASLCSVLLCYSLGREKKYLASSVAGFASLWFRQTNVVWVGFTAVTSALDVLEERIGLGSKQPRKVSYISESSNGGLRLTPLTFVVRTYLAAALQEWKVIARVLGIYLPVLLAFVTFVLWNGGIVLGHQEMHVASLHYAQVPYFLAFSTLLGWPVLFNEGIRRPLSRAIRLGSGTKTRTLCSAILLGLMVMGIKYGTVVHPFLLADNRHYFFYVWRRIFGLHWSVRYALAPCHLVCLWLWAAKLGERRSLPWLVAFFACTAAVLVPTPLVEPRYFMVPYTIMSLHSIRPDTKEGARIPWTQFCFNMTVNAVTLFVFLKVKFKWDDWEGWMRFMW